MTIVQVALLLPVVGFVLFCVSAVESALFSLREHRINTLSAGNSSLERRLREFLATKETRLGQALVLSALCNTCMAALGLLLVRELSPHLILSPLALGSIVFACLIIVCHLLPNLLASLRPHFVFSTIAPLVIGLSAVILPFERVLKTLAGWMAKALVPNNIRPSEPLLDEEIDTLVAMRRDEGTLDDLEGEIIHEILKLGDKTAKDCMTPRVDAATLSLDLPAGEASRHIREQTHRFVPVYEGKPDEIVGILDVTSYLRSGDSSLRPHVRPPTFVPETLGALGLFHRHLRGPGSIVIVLDEFGGFEGIVTRSDVIEHLVGDAAPTEDIEIQELDGGRFLLSGSARLDELGEATGVDLEADGLDTIGGLIATTLGRIPSPGERVQLDPFIVTVRKSTAKRVEELLLERGEHT